MIKRPGGFAAIENLDVYYEDCVIGGPGAFVVVVRSAGQFTEAIRRKLVLEIAGGARAGDCAPRRRGRASGSTASSARSCAGNG